MDHFITATNGSRHSNLLVLETVYIQLNPLNYEVELRTFYSPLKPLNYEGSLGFAYTKYPDSPPRNILVYSSNNTRQILNSRVNSRWN